METRDLGRRARLYRAAWEEENPTVTASPWGCLAQWLGSMSKPLRILGETIEAHPDKFDADLELVKIIKARSNSTKPSRRCKRSMTGVALGTSMCSRPTLPSSSTNQLDKGARLLGDYKRVWLQQKRRSERMSGRLTAAQQGQRSMPYGHGIGIAYYHTVLDQDDQAERLLRDLIAFDPDQYGADNELATFYKNRGKLRTARNSIAQNYDRGGDKDTSTVVNYAGILRQFEKTTQALKSFSPHIPSEAGEKILSLRTGRLALGDETLSRGQEKRSASSSSCTPEVADFSVALSKAMQAMGEEEEAISTLKESIKRYPEQFAADIALSQLYGDRGQKGKAVTTIERAYKRPNGESLPVLKQYIRALAENGSVERFAKVCRPTKSCGKQKKGYGDGITMGFYASNGRSR